jgi:hypothetical protein
MGEKDVIEAFDISIDETELKLESGAFRINCSFYFNHIFTVLMFSNSNCFI